MRIHQKMVMFFKKIMKAYFKVVILSIKIYENILKFNFLIPPPPPPLSAPPHLGMLTVYASFSKRSFSDVKNDQGMVNCNHAKIPLN